jgi:APA family basic amino acid/polyamine antiporter
MSRVAWSMSADRNLPGWLSRLHPKYGTPYRVLWLYALVYSVMVALPFEALLVADIWVSGAYTMILLATLVRARRQARAVGFRVPGGNAGLFLTAAVPAFTWLVFLALTWKEHALMGVGLLLIGPVLWTVGHKVLRLRPAVSRTAT